MSDQQLDNIISTNPNDNERGIYDTSSKFKIHVFGSELSNKYPDKLGKISVLFYFKDIPLITIGPSFSYSLLLFTILLLFILMFVLFIYPFLPFAYLMIATIIDIVKIISLSYTVLINAGIPERQSYISKEFINSLDIFPKSLYETYSVCRKCNIVVRMNKKALHCDDCEICIEGMDHHCIWIGKCIGKNNHFSFWVFIMVSLLSLVYSIFLLIVTINVL